MSADSFFDDEAWDEERWEAFLRDNDKRVDRYMDLIFQFMHDHPRPEAADPSAFDAWKAALRSFLRDKGWRREDISLPFLWLEEEHAEDAAEDDALEDDALFFEDDAFEDDFDDLERLPLYRRALDFADEVMDWAEALAGGEKDSTLVHFCLHAGQVAANIARGHGIGRERDALGGNIACAKRGLADANAALDLLRQMKRASYMDAATYRRLYEHAFELRNQLGLYVQELRDQFNLGID